MAKKKKKQSPPWEVPPMSLWSDEMKQKFRKSLDKSQDKWGWSLRLLWHGGIYVRRNEDGKLGFIPWSRGDDGFVRLDSENIQWHTEENLMLKADQKGPFLERAGKNRGKAYIGPQARSFQELHWQ